MSSSKFSVRRAVVVGWECLQNNFMIFLGGGLVISLMQFAQGYWPSPTMWLLLVTIISMVVNLMLLKGSLVGSRGKKLTLKEMELTMADLLHLIMGIFLLGIIFAIIPIILGFFYGEAIRLTWLTPSSHNTPLISFYFIAVILPALVLELFLSTKLVFVPYLILDQKMDVFRAIKESFALSRGIAVKIFGLLFILGMFNFAVLFSYRFIMAPLLGLGVSQLILYIAYGGLTSLGTAIRYPITFAAVASAYDQLQGGE